MILLGSGGAREEAVVLLLLDDVLDLLSLLKVIALWTVADGDLLRCLCCGEPPIGDGYDGCCG